jgi:hypothetical protein
MADQFRIRLDALSIFTAALPPPGQRAPLMLPPNKCATLQTFATDWSEAVRKCSTHLTPKTLD